MKVYGADFSPSRGIYYAEGSLNGHTLNLERVVHCDDRLDLLVAIHFSKAPWGLDFPFSIPAEAHRLLKLKSWGELLKLAGKAVKIDGVFSKKARGFLIIIARNAAIKLYRKRKNEIKNIDLNRYELAFKETSSRLPQDIVITNEAIGKMQV